MLLKDRSELRTGRAENIMKLPFFKKADIILIAALIVIGAAGLLAVRPADRSGTYVVMTVDGEQVDTLGLSEDQSVRIDTQYGSNLITVKNGSVFVSEADCPGKDCISLGKISRSGQIIVCLPHHLVIKIVGQNEGAPDAVVR